MKSFKKIQIAAAVMAATAGIAVSTAQADSLLAPLILNSSAGTTSATETFLSLRTGAVIAPVNGLHYHWIRKNVPVGGVTPPAIESLRNLTQPCSVVNSFGQATPRDMVYQRTYGDANFVSFPIPGLVDNSVGSGFPDPEYAGMLVVTIDAAEGVEEGNFLGFVYIIDAVNGTMIDYKMLNNHQTTRSGNFQAGFMAKKSVDYSWLPATLVNTMWYSAVVGPDMTRGPEQAGVYDATVVIGNQARIELDGSSNQESPQVFMGGKGVFNNDENFLSGALDFPVTCVGMYDRSAFIDNSHLGFTANGGWARRSITPVAGTSSVAKGAITYKWEKATGTGPLGALIGGNNIPVSWTVETGGNLSLNGTKANRPY